MTSLKARTDDKNMNGEPGHSSWLGFSLSPQQQNYLSPTPPPTHLIHNNIPGIFYGVHDPSPKLEDFLGGAGGEESMVLSLDSISPDSNRHNREQRQQPCFASGTIMPCNGLCQTPLDEEGAENGAKEVHENCVLGSNWLVPPHNPDLAYVQVQQLMVDENRAACYGSVSNALSLSMSRGSHQFSSCLISHGVRVVEECKATKKRGAPQKVVDQKQQRHVVHRKSIDTFGQRTSQFRGVTRHRWTGRYEAHLWDNSCEKEGQTRKGRQVYLGGYDVEQKAARAYDLAAIKYWGPSTLINFSLENYQAELKEMKNMSRQQYVSHLRRKSSGFSRGASIYRGVTRHHQHGRWQARIGRVAGNKDLYLGTFSTQEEAAEAYDVAAIRFRGITAVTNFDMSKYHVDRILTSSTLLGGELVKKNQRDQT